MKREKSSGNKGEWSEERFSADFRLGGRRGAASDFHQQRVKWHKHKNSTGTKAELARLQAQHAHAKDLAGKARIEYLGHRQDWKAHQEAGDAAGIARSNIRSSEAARNEFLHRSHAQALHNTIRDAKKWHNAISKTEKAKATMAKMKGKVAKPVTVKAHTRKKTRSLVRKHPRKKPAKRKSARKAAKKR